MSLQFWHGLRRTILAVALMGAFSASMAANDRARGAGIPDKSPLTKVTLNETDGQILSYRHLAGSTDVHMRGTQLAPGARVRMKIGSRPGFVELDINRGDIVGLKPAQMLGKDFLTYVLWAVSVDGRASNLGEITFEGDRAVSVNVTTPYQTFWVMVTAEPSYAVVDPSRQVVLFSVKQSSTGVNKALPIRGELFFFTHYTSYTKDARGAFDSAPNQLLQARKAFELASKSEIMVAGRSGRTGLNEEDYTRKALEEASTFLKLAEDAYRKNPGSQEVIQFARTAAQSAENARALAMGAVGGLAIRRLQEEVTRLEGELARLRPGPELAGAKAPDALPPPVAPLPGVPAIATAAPVSALAPPLAKQPAIWFAIAGWLLAIVVLFRRRSA